MAFNNVGNILRINSPFSSLKLLLLAASCSRPQLRQLFFSLLRPFTKDGQVMIRYQCYDRYLLSYVRLSDLNSDVLSVLELSVRDTYDLDLNYKPDLVIDGGGNIGLFTLRAAAATSASGSTPARFVICEPLPRNIEQIEKHITLNHVPAQIMAGCLGGEGRTIPFYCREAIHSSFDPQKPYTSVIDMPVYTLHDAIGSAPAERILIKLDIEGMEIEALHSFVPSERRAVYIVGELHGYAVNAPVLERIFRDYGWTFLYTSIADDHANFRACSPAALPLLTSMAGVSPAQAA